MERIRNLVRRPRPPPLRRRRRRHRRHRLKRWHLKQPDEIGKGRSRARARAVERGGKEGRREGEGRRAVRAITFDSKLLLRRKMASQIRRCLPRRVPPSLPLFLLSAHRRLADQIDRCHATDPTEPPPISAPSPTPARAPIPCGGRLEGRLAIQINSVA